MPSRTWEFLACFLYWATAVDHDVYMDRQDRQRHRQHSTLGLSSEYTCLRAFFKFDFVIALHQIQSQSSKYLQIIRLHICSFMFFVIFSSFCVKPSLSEWLSLLDEPVQNATRTHTHKHTHTHAKIKGGGGFVKCLTRGPKHWTNLTHKKSHSDGKCYPQLMRKKKSIE